MSGESAKNADGKDWHSSKQIRKRARYLLDHPDEQIPSDVTFLVGDGQNEPQKIFKCHKFLLAMVSSMFQAMFYGSFPESEDPIKIPDVTPTAFQYMLRYTYGENVGSKEIRSLEDGLDILYCAKKYLIPKLARTCRDDIQFCVVGLDSDPCVVFQRAPQMDEEDLADLALAQIAQSTPYIMKGDTFLRLSFDCLKKIVDCTYLAAKETEVYRAVCRWVEHNVGVAAGKTFVETFGTLLYSIRFPLFGAKELADGPVADGVLTGDEATSVYQSILAEIKPPVPFLTTPRIPLAAPEEYFFRLLTAPATVLPGKLTSNELLLFTRPDLAPECCAFLRHLVENELHIRFASYDNEHLDETAPLPAGLSEERNVLSHSINGACWFEWDTDGGAARDLRIGIAKKPHLNHSAVFGFVFGIENENLWVPAFNFWDDKCIQSVASFQVS